VVVQDKFPLAKSVHKWFGRAMNLYAFLVAWTGKIFFKYLKIMIHFFLGC
jgi:hypothetical protein